MTQTHTYTHILHALTILCTTINFFAHSAQSQKEIDLIIHEMRSALAVYDVEKVRTALKTGIFSHERDFDSYQNPIQLIDRLFKETSQPPRTNKDGWQDRAFTILGLLCSETKLPMNTVVNYYNDNHTVRSSYTLLQACLFEHWRCDIMCHSMPNKGIPRIKIAQELVKKGARLHYKDGFGNSAVHRMTSLLISSYPKDLSDCLKTTVDNLKSVYPKNKKIGHGNTVKKSGPTTFARDVRQIDFTAGVLEPITLSDRACRNSDLVKLTAGDIECLCALYALQQKTNRYYQDRIKLLHRVDLGLPYLSLPIVSLVFGYLGEKTTAKVCIESYDEICQKVQHRCDEIDKEWQMLDAGHAKIVLAFASRYVDRSKLRV